MFGRNATKWRRLGAIGWGYISGFGRWSEGRKTPSVRRGYRHNRPRNRGGLGPRIHGSLTIAPRHWGVVAFPACPQYSARVWRAVFINGTAIRSKRRVDSQGCNDKTVSWGAGFWVSKVTPVFIFVFIFAHLTCPVFSAKEQNAKRYCFASSNSALSQAASKGFATQSAIPPPCTAKSPAPSAPAPHPASANPPASKTIHSLFIICIIPPLFARRGDDKPARIALRHTRIADKRADCARITYQPCHDSCTGDGIQL